MNKNLLNQLLRDSQPPPKLLAKQVTGSPSPFIYSGSLSVRLCSACEVSSLTTLNKNNNNKNHNNKMLQKGISSVTIM